MTLKDVLNTSKNIVLKNKIKIQSRPSLAGVHQINNKYLATDSFKAIKIVDKMGNEEVNQIINQKTFEKIEEKNLLPEYEESIEKVLLKEEPQSIVYLDPKLLNDLVSAFKNDKYVKLSLYGEKKNIMIESGDAETFKRGILCSLNITKDEEDKFLKLKEE